MRAAIEKLTPSADFERLERGWIRREADRHPIHVADGADASPVHLTYPRGYDSRCGWCYLNAPHSEAAHAERIGEVTR